MKSWLPVLLEHLPQSPVLALSSRRNLARPALYNRQGGLLAGDLGSPVLTAQVAEEARNMQVGECRLLVQQDQIALECLTPGPDSSRFWRAALENQKDAWASWLLTMPVLKEGNLKMTRHILSAFGPWTNPRLPEILRDYWSLLPLKPGLGRLFVLGDDELALELAALAGRTGLTTTWLTTRKKSVSELKESQSLGEFDCFFLKSWEDLNFGKFAGLGIKEGVRLVATASLRMELREDLKSIPTAYLMLAGDGEVGSEPLSLNATTTQKALTLISAMLS